MKLHLLLASSATALVLSACSGASGTELFAPPDTAQLGSTPSPSDPGTAASSGSSAGTSGSSGSSSSSSGGSSSSSGGSSSSSSGTTDAGPGTSKTIACGTSPSGTKTTCAATAEVCCGSWRGGAKPELGCEPTGFGACVGATVIGCDDRTDCPNGQVCCGTLEENAGYTSVVCKASCNSSPGRRAVRFCDDTAAIDECAPSGKSCGPSQGLPGYSVCRD